MNWTRWSMIGKVLLGVWMAGVLVAAFLVEKPDLGQVGRIYFFHIPVAWVTVLSFLLSSLYGIRYLVKRQRLDDHRAANAATLGIVFCLLATVTGAIFARVTWGAFWNWDPRETTIFFLLLFYAAYFALRAAVADEERRATLAAAYNILGLVVVPLLVFVAPRMAELAGLHPNELLIGGQGGMSPPVRRVFLAALAGFTGVFVWVLDLANRTARLGEALADDEEA